MAGLLAKGIGAALQGAGAGLVAHGASLRESKRAKMKEEGLDRRSNAAITSQDTRAANALRVTEEGQAATAAYRTQAQTDAEAGRVAASALGNKQLDATIAGNKAAAERAVTAEKNRAANQERDDKIRADTIIFNKDKSERSDALQATIIKNQGLAASMTAANRKETLRLTGIAQDAARRANELQLTRINTGVVATREHQKREQAARIEANVAKHRLDMIGELGKQMDRESLNTFRELTTKREIARDKVTADMNAWVKSNKSAGDAATAAHRATLEGTAKNKLALDEKKLMTEIVKNFTDEGGTFDRKGAEQAMRMVGLDPEKYRSPKPKSEPNAVFIEQENAWGVQLPDGSWEIVEDEEPVTPVVEPDSPDGFGGITPPPPDMRQPPVEDVPRPQGGLLQQNEQTEAVTDYYNQRGN